MSVELPEAYIISTQMKDQAARTAKKIEKLNLGGQVLLPNMPKITN